MTCVSCGPTDPRGKLTPGNYEAFDALYASSSVDFFKVDCVSSAYGDQRAEIGVIRKAIEKPT